MRKFITMTVVVACMAPSMIISGVATYQRNGGGAGGWEAEVVALSFAFGVALSIPMCTALLWQLRTASGAMASLWAALFLVLAPLVVAMSFGAPFGVVAAFVALCAPIGLTTAGKGGSQ